MKSTLLISLLLFSVNLLFAQTASIKRTIKSDEASIGFVGIELLNIADAKQKQHTWSDSIGRYQFEIKQTGKYIIKASLYGL